MQELIVKRLDGSTILRRYVNWESFKKADLEKLKLELEIELNKINNLLAEFNK